MSNAVKGIVALLAVIAIGTGGYFVAKVTTTTTTTSTTTTTTTTTSTTVPHALACQAKNFAGVLAQGQGAAGTIYSAVDLTNNGASCTLDGFAGLTLYSATGATMTATVIQDGTAFSSQDGVPTTPSLVTVPNGAKAHFALAYSDVPVGTQVSCPNVATFAVTLPDSTTGDTAITVHGNNNFVLCGTGQVTISPFYL